MRRGAGNKARARGGATVDIAFLFNCVCILYLSFNLYHRECDGAVKLRVCRSSIDRASNPKPLPQCSISPIVQPNPTYDLSITANSLTILIYVPCHPIFNPSSILFTPHSLHESPSQGYPPRHHQQRNHHLHFEFSSQPTHLPLPFISIHVRSQSPHLLTFPPIVLLHWVMSLWMSTRGCCRALMGMRSILRSC